MTRKPAKVVSISKQQNNRALKHRQLPPEMVLPPGSTFDDFFITAQDVMSQLKVGRRQLNNMRQAGEIPYTYIGKTRVYLKQELAAMLLAGLVIGKKSILRQLNVDLF
jgi:hypothetical protein